ncbi:DsbA family protein [Aliivibrio finisterrensis]|uniref:DsbA family protein n=1 Tax=Aliivibrio finisterrensis TaxID=511998 RepID=A0A6N6RQY1_9GAMM|nr:DsbA family protein [Aliivibrio finisterrensis]KAB2823963.1 DsbA family protein [Aliivibrio finisterrensis]
MKFKTKLITTLVMACLFSPLASAMTQSEKIQDINEMLKGNPAIIDSLHESLAMYIVQQGNYQKTLADYHDYMYNNPNLPSFGAKDPKLTIVVLTDLSCPWCKKLDPVLMRLVEENPDDLKVINIYVPLKEHLNPINSATFAMRVWKESPEKFNIINETLWSKPGIHNVRSVMKVAKANDAEKYVSTDKEVEDMVAKNRQLFTDLGARGTPAMLIDGQLLPGYLPYEKLAPMVEDKIAEKSGK